MDEMLVNFEIISLNFLIIIFSVILKYICLDKYN